MAADLRLPARRVVASFGLAFALALAACGSERPPAGTHPARGGEGGAAPEASLCDPGTSWGEPETVDVGSADPLRFGSITPDELSIAWLMPGAEGEASVFYADRASLDVPFEPGRALAESEGFFALDSAALSFDGLSLVVVRIDHFGFGVATRQSRDEGFGEVVPGAYANLNPNQRDTQPNETEIADPVLAPDDLGFVYSEYAQTFEDTVRIAIRNEATDYWTSTVAFLTPELRPEGALRRRPSGIASDYRTLFYWDEIDGVERAAFRTSATSDFTEFVELDAFQYAQPNADCTRLYFGQGDTLAFARAE